MADTRYGQQPALVGNLLDNDIACVSRAPYIVGSPFVYYTQDQLANYIKGKNKFAWTIVTINTSMLANNGYLVSGGVTIDLQLPAVSAVGDVIEIASINSLSKYVIKQGNSQSIIVGISTTTVGAAGSLSSLFVGDSLKMVCCTANTKWIVVNSVGNFTVI